MIKRILLLHIVLLCAIGSHAQDSLQNRYINASYGHIIGGVDPGMYIFSHLGYNFGSAIIIDITPWKLCKNVSAGFYLGGGIASYSESRQSPIITTVAGRFGLSARWHVLPLLSATSHNKWDIALGGNIGSYWSPYAQLNIEYAASISAGYYPFNHWGICAEYGWGKFLYGQSGSSCIFLGNTLIKAGVSYRW